ncbi:MAG TPA: copper resistance protein CopC [Microbacteriaceae bacterium]|nr:copper resistance protein CopC [Microbacteriaceae bacterium]
MTTRLLRILALAIALFGMNAAVSPAFAHDELQTTSPANGDLLEIGPANVSVTFGEEVIELGTTIVVLNHDGSDVVAGPVTVSGATVSAPLAADLTPGVYTVEWRVVSKDGHPVTGTFVFGVGSGQAIADELEIAAAVAEAAEAGAGAELPSPGRTDTANTATRQAQSPFLLIVGGLAAAGVLAAGLLLVRRRGDAERNNLRRRGQ